VILAVGYGVWVYNNNHKVSYQFRGVVSEFNTDSMVLEGNNVLLGKVSAETYGSRVVTAFVNQETEYVRRVVPSNGLVVDLASSTAEDLLEKVTKEDFEREVKNLNSIVSVNSADNIYGESGFRIISAEYTVVGQR